MNLASYSGAIGLAGSSGDLRNDQSKFAGAGSLYDILADEPSITSWVKQESWKQNIATIMEHFFRQAENEKNKPNSQPRPKHKNKKPVPLPNQTRYAIIPIRQQFCVKLVRRESAALSRSERML